MNPRFVYVVLYLALALWIQPVSGSNLQLVASSPFSLLLQPLTESPSQQTLTTIEESVSTTILKQHNGSLYIEMQTAVQKVQFFKSSNRSQVQFFTLASRKPENKTLAFFRLELNTFMENVLVDSPLGRASLLRELVSSDDSNLAGIDSFEIVPLQPVKQPGDRIPQQPVTPATSRRKRLSSLDIILIVCCVLIFLGIMYMIIQHHQDRGFIENQRLRAFNRHSTDAESDSVNHGIIVSKNSSASLGQFTLGAGVAPSTPSTIHSTDALASYFSTPERRVHRVNAMTPKALLGASSVDGSSVQSIFEGLDSDWPQLDDPKKTTNQNINYDASSDTSDDPFQVDVEAADSATDTDTDTERSKAGSVLQEWMMSVQVVPNPSSSTVTKTSEITQPSVEVSSAPSLAQTSLDVSSIDHRSLEQSLASSEADDRFSTSARIVKIEV